MKLPLEFPGNWINRKWIDPFFERHGAPRSEDKIHRWLTRTIDWLWTIYLALVGLMLIYGSLVQFLSQTRKFVIHH